MKELTSVLQVFLKVDSAVKDMFNSASLSSEFIVRFFLQFLGLSFQSLKMMLSIPLLGWLMRLMVRLFPHR
ncbi:hypothetical protein DPMN_040745 [Dreissena polymorpha]|uniref:Uncharacterized protein n=1 Tax=Dreissena polymorpha TaxID=45954 RepID=A0A9D4HX81_DREPO|nr:hypothetical protein DPMN_040745 [Dreissena polymorpha]